MAVQKRHKMGLSVTYGCIAEPGYVWTQLLIQLWILLYKSKGERSAESGFWRCFSISHFCTNNSFQAASLFLSIAGQRKYIEQVICILERLKIIHSFQFLSA